MKELRLGIIGLGIGRVNGDAFVKHPRGRVVALCDLIEEKMADYSKDLPDDPRCYVDYKKLCRDPDVDAIMVATPNQWHAPMAIEAMRCGKHVLVTKPLADGLAAARRAVKAAESAGVVNMMSLSTRFGPAMRYLGALRSKGDFGDLYYARARSIRRSGIPDWNLGFIAAGGGAFRDMGVHALDAAWWVLGMPRPISVSGVAGARFGPKGKGYWDFHTPKRSFWRKYDSDDYAGGFIRFAGDVGLQIESFWASHQPEEFQIELFGSAAGARLDPLTVYRTRAGAPEDAHVTLPPGPGPWYHIANHFIECVLDGVPCTAPLRHGMIVQQMMEAMLTSAATGKEVRIRPPK